MNWRWRWRHCQPFLGAIKTVIRGTIPILQVKPQLKVAVTSDEGHVKVWLLRTESPWFLAIDASHKSILSYISGDQNVNTFVTEGMATTGTLEGESGSNTLTFGIIMGEIPVVSAPTEGATHVPMITRLMWCPPYLRKHTWRHHQNQISRTPPSTKP